MKKLIAVILMAALALSICACSPINKTDVAVLWADTDTAASPNDLINAMDRAMYIENIGYTYYGAEGDAAKQLTQAQEALSAGCAVLMVEPVDPTAAAQFVELAKTADTPVLFFGADVDDTVAAGWEKCYIVKTDATTLVSTFFDLMGEYVLSNAEDMDLDGDGKISYVTVGDIQLDQDKVVKKGDDGEPLYKKDGSYEKAVDILKLEVAFADLQPEEVTEEAGGLFGGTTTYRKLKTADGKVVEMLLVADDAQAKDVLIALQGYGMNADQLATCFVPLFTVGNEVDYKALVLEGAPAEGDARKEHLEKNKFLCDLTTVEADDLDKMIFTTINVIGTGRITGTAIENYDGIAGAAAKTCATLIKDGAAENITMVPYTTFTK